MYDTEYGVQRRSESFLYGVYAWMTAALLLTAVTAYTVATTPVLFSAVFAQPFAPFILFLFQIILVLVMSFYIMRMSFAVALVCFLVFAVSLGFTLSVIFHVYELPSIYRVFVIAAGMFGIMSVYGYFTRTDLTAVGSIGIMFLFGLILALIVNFFIRSSAFDLMLSFFGVLVFTMLTAADTQRIKRLSLQLVGEEEVIAKVALMGALALYLDFINMFLFLLRILGQRR